MTDGPVDGSWIPNPRRRDIVGTYTKTWFITGAFSWLGRDTSRSSHRDEERRGRYWSPRSPVSDREASTNRPRPRHIVSRRLTIELAFLAVLYSTLVTLELTLGAPPDVNFIVADTVFFALAGWRTVVITRRRRPEFGHSVSA